MVLYVINMEVQSLQSIGKEKEVVEDSSVGDFDEKDDDVKEDDAEFNINDDGEGVSVHLNVDDIVVELRECIHNIEGLSNYSLASSYETLCPFDCDVNHQEDHMEFTYKIS